MNEQYYSSGGGHKSITITGGNGSSVVSGHISSVSGSGNTNVHPIRLADLVTLIRVRPLSNR
jgi:hypothetical protein